MVVASKRSHSLLNNRGQGSVEYVLLLVAVVSLVVFVFNSSTFQNFFGPNSPFFTSIKKTMQYTYRHGGLNPSLEDGSSDPGGNIHESYTTDGGGSRFFFVYQPYPVSP